MIDLHCHILPGIDDGPETLDETVELARAAVAAGTTTMVATSHVSPRYPNDAGTIARGVAEVTARLAAEEIDLEVRAGGEVAISQIEGLGPGELRRFASGAARGSWSRARSP